VDFAAAESYLADLQMFGIKLGLENVKRLAEYAGVGAGTPALAQMHFIHIAGSNGKGSTGAMLEAMLRKTGNCTGFYSSPHLIVSRERIRINGCAVAEAQWGEAFDTVYAASERMRQEGCCPTYFEFQTVLALELFAAGNVE
jgi:folylpolyglutamate synthase/dihydropteroate synthase